MFFFFFTFSHYYTLSLLLFFATNAFVIITTNPPLFVFMVMSVKTKNPKTNVCDGCGLLYGTLNRNQRSWSLDQFQSKPRSEMSLCSVCRRLLEASGGCITRVRSSYALSTRLREQWRSINFLPSMADKLSSAPQRRKDYREEKILG